MLEIQEQILQENYGYINARVRAMQSVLLRREYYEDLLKASDFSSIMSLLEKTPYKAEIQECAISHSGVEGIDEALKRNLSRTFNKILNFTGGEPRDLILIVLGRWDLHNIITILRGIQINVPSEQILESLIPAGELDIPSLTQLTNERNIKGVINVLATWGSPYARILNEKYPEYMEENDLSILELALEKEYYTNAFKKIKGFDLNSKIVRELFAFEIDATNVTTIIRLQKISLGELVRKKRVEKELEEKERLKKEKAFTLKEKIKAWWDKVTLPYEGEEQTNSKDKIENRFLPINNKITKRILLKRLWKNNEIILGRKFEEYKKSREKLLERISDEKNSFKKIWLYLNSYLIEKPGVKKKVQKEDNLKKLMEEIKQSYEKIKRSIFSAKKNAEITAEEEKTKIEAEIRRLRIKDFYIPGGKEIEEENFINMCLNLDVEKVVKDLENTSFGPILKSVLDRYLEYNTLSVLERKLEELIALKGVNTYRIDQLCIGIPIGYILKKYNEIVNLRIVVRCKAIGMPDRKIREELVLL